MHLTRKGPIYVLLATGFEEYDVIAVTRALRRYGLPVALVGLTAGPIRGCSGMSMAIDKTLSETEAEEPQAVVLPGGIQGLRHLNSDPRVHNLLHRAVKHGGYLVSCARENVVLRTAGIGPEAHPQPEVGPLSSSTEEWDQAVVVDGQLVWGRDAESVPELVTTLVSLFDPAHKTR